jgi:hypothetical protein
MGMLFVSSLEQGFEHEREDEEGDGSISLRSPSENALDHP